MADNDKSIQKKRREFEAEALQHLGVLYETAYHLARNETTAEDLVQETCLRAFRFWDKYEKGTNCRAWLLRILRNTFINQYRRKAPETDRVDPTELDQYYNQLVDSATIPEQRDPSQELFANLVFAHSGQQGHRMPQAGQVFGHVAGRTSEGSADVRRV